MIKNDKNIIVEIQMPRFTQIPWSALAVTQEKSENRVGEVQGNGYRSESSSEEEGEAAAAK